MLLTIHNLPAGTQYGDVKQLIISKCGLRDSIVDNLQGEGNSMCVTVGVIEDEDAAILVRKINGLYYGGQQLYVENKRQKRESEQPYRTKMAQEPGYPQSLMQQHGMSYDYSQIPPMGGMVMGMWPPNQPMPNHMFQSQVPQVPSGPQAVQNPYMAFGQQQSTEFMTQYSGGQTHKQQGYGAQADDLFSRRLDAPAQGQARGSRWDEPAREERRRPGSPLAGNRAPEPKRPRWEQRNERTDTNISRQDRFQDRGGRSDPNASNFSGDRGRRPERRGRWEPDRRMSDRPDSDRREPDRREYNRREPNRREPDHREPDRREPNRREREPDRREPDRFEPDRREPDRFEPDRREPDRREPDRREPDRREPDRRELDRHELDRRNQLAGQPHVKPDTWDKYPPPHPDQSPTKNAEPVTKRVRKDTAGQAMQIIMLNILRMLKLEHLMKGANPLKTALRKIVLARVNDILRDTFMKPNDVADVYRNIYRSNVDVDMVIAIQHKITDGSIYSVDLKEFGLSFVHGEQYLPTNTQALPQGSNFGQPQRPQMNAPGFGNHPRPQTNAAGFGNSQMPQINAPSFGQTQRPQTNAPSFGKQQRPQMFGFGNQQKPQMPAPRFGNPQRPQASVPRFGNPQRHMAPTPNFGNQQRPQTSAQTFKKPQNPKPGPKFGKPKKSPANSDEYSSAYDFKQTIADAIGPIITDTTKSLHSVPQFTETALIKSLLKIVLAERVRQIAIGKEVKVPKEVMRQLYRQQYPVSSDAALHASIKKIIAEKNGKMSTGEMKQFAVQCVANIPNQTANIPTYAKGDKRVYKKQKQEHTQSLQTLKCYDMDEKYKVALRAEVEDIATLIKNILKETLGKDENVFEKINTGECIMKCRKFFEYHISRRITDIGVKLARVFCHPKLPNRATLAQFFVKYNCLSIKKSGKSPFFTATFDSFETIDQLCRMSPMPMNGQITVTVKPMHIAPKKPKYSQKHKKNIRKKYIQSLIEYSDVDLLDKNWPAQQEAEEKAKAEGTFKPKSNTKDDATPDPNPSESDDVIFIGGVEINTIDISDDEKVEKVEKPNKTDDEGFLHKDFKVIDEVRESDNDDEAAKEGHANQVFDDWDENGEEWGDVSETTAEDAAGDESHQNTEISGENAKDGDAKAVEGDNSLETENAPNAKVGSDDIDDEEIGENMDGIDIADVDFDNVDENDLEDY